MRSLLLIAFATIAASGCTHAQLRRSTVNQTGTVAEIYQQQVLNNLAKFAHDPHALPDFGVPTSGTAEVTDRAGAKNTFGWTNTLLDGIGFDIDGSRQLRQTWALTPVQDPRKLELMRCAYQRAVGYANCTSCCIGCEKRFRNFYTGDVCGRIPESCQICPNCEVCEEGDSECLERNKACEKLTDASRKDKGTVTSNCLESCWFHVGCADCLDKIRKENPCCLVGEHCGTVVWVCPGRGSEQLSRLTIAILDYAVNDPPTPPADKTKEVVGYFKADGSPANKHNANYQVTATLKATDFEGKDFGEKEALKATDSLKRLMLGQEVTSSDLRAAPVETEMFELIPQPSPEKATVADNIIEAQRLLPSQTER